MSDNESPDHLSTLPPLRIHHFLVWMVVAAAVLAASRFLNQEVMYHDFGYQEIQIYVDYLAQAQSITVVGFALYWRRDGYSFFGEPGRALLLIGTTALLGRLILTVLLGARVESSEWGHVELIELPSQVTQWLKAWSGWVYSALLCLIYGVSAWYSKADRWRRFFLLLLVLELGSLIVWKISIAMLPSTPGLSWFDWGVAIPFGFAHQVIAIVYVALLSLFDHREKIRHHWSHWCGVVVFLICQVVALGTDVYGIFIWEGWTIPILSISQT
jgi:hypothetical protein